MAMRPWAKIKEKLSAGSNPRGNGSLRLDIGSKTDIGRVRDGNEDHFCVVPELQLVMVSDGMGGEASGEVASELAVESISKQCLESAHSDFADLPVPERPEFSHRTNCLLNAVRLANQLIHAASLEDSEKRGMGATVVAAWIDGLRLSLVHVGDSRVYLFRAGALERLTYDHTLVAEQVRIGILTPQQANTSAWQSVLIRALGTNEQVDLDVEERDLLPGDVLLLGSDGLTRMVPDPEISGVLADSRTAQAAADRLVALANQRGGEDNITVIVVRIPK